MTTTIRHNPALRLVAVLALACGMFAAASSTAGAAPVCQIDDYGPAVVLTATPTQTSPGSAVTVDGSGFPANCEVALSISGSQAGTVTTDGSGNFSYTWMVPDDQEVGPVTISATAGGETLGSTVVEIIAGGPTTTTTTTPQTTTPGGTTPSGPTAPGAGSPGTGQGTGSGGQGSGNGILPATGSQVLPFVFGGIVLLALGAGLIVLNRRRDLDGRI